MILSQRGQQLLKNLEGFKSCPYLDQVKIPTIGIGTTVYPNGQLVSLKDSCITLQQGFGYLQSHIRTRITKFIAPKIKVSLTQNQTDAIIVLVYNIGAGAFIGSTVLKRINIDPNDKPAVTEAWLMWKNAGGQPILLNRRKQELQLYFS